MTFTAPLIAITETGSVIPDQILQPEEMTRADAYKTTQRREQFLLSRVLLRALLERQTGSPAQSFAFRADEHGKPICIDGPSISITHSRNIVACAVCTDGAIGIDLEFPGRHRNIAGIAKRFFASEESEWLSAQPDDRFYMLWVLKEAWLKAIGTGIAGGLDRLQCLVSPPTIDAVAAGGELEALRLFNLQAGFLGIATTVAPLDEVEVLRWHVSTNEFVPAGGVLPIAAYPSGI
jgi:4'-phosphopantetheinyl transferase